MKYQYTCITPECDNIIERDKKIMVNPRCFECKEFRKQLVAVGDYGTVAALFSQNARLEGIPIEPERVKSGRAKNFHNPYPKCATGCGEPAELPYCWCILCKKEFVNYA